MNSIPLVSVIIVNYNTRHLIKNCLESLHRQSFKDMEIFVVDNASEDGSVEYIKDVFTDVKTIPLSKNIGFAGANVEALKYARGDYIMLLNTDSEADKECIGNLVAVMEGDPGVGICASKIIAHDTGLIDSAGDGYATSLKGFKRGEGEDSRGFNEQEYVFGACAGAALYRRTMLKEIGFFDEDFFLIHEDTDLNLRAQLTDWRIIYVPTAIVYHRVRSTIGHMSDVAVYYTLRNTEFVRIKNIPLTLFVRCLPEFILGAIFEFIYFAVKHGRLRLYLKAKIDVIKNLRIMWNKRREVMNMKKVDNRYLYSIMTPLWNKGFLSMKVKKFIYG